MSLLDKANNDLSTLHYAVELQQLAAKVGFDWSDVRGVIDKVHEELQEVTEEIDKSDNDHRLLDEMGDLFFVCASLARHLNIDPELALQQGSDKFARRFKQVEQLAEQQQLILSELSHPQLDHLWLQVKQQEKGS